MLKTTLTRSGFFIVRAGGLGFYAFSVSALRYNTKGFF